MTDERFNKGIKTLQKMDFGINNDLNDMLKDISPDFYRYIMEFPFGDIYSRPGLNLKTREIVTISALIAKGAFQQLGGHIGLALNTGVTEEEIKEIIIQLAVYAGFPNAFSAMQVAEEVFKERKKMPYWTLCKDEFSVIGICVHTNIEGKDGNQVVSDIQQLWTKFHKEKIALQIPNRINDDIIALYTDYEGDYTRPYNTVIGCAVSDIKEIPEGMVAKTVPASKYAVFRTKEFTPKSVIDKWKHIWCCDIKREYKGDFEVYRDGVFAAIKYPVDIYIGIK